MQLLVIRMFPKSFCKILCAFLPLQMHRPLLILIVFLDPTEIFRTLLISVPYKRKKVQKVRNFFRHFRTEILRIPAFFLPLKTGGLFPAKNLRQPRFTAPRSGTSQKSRRKVAELRRRTFFFSFFFGEQRKIAEKNNASIGVMTFFFFWRSHLNRTKMMRKFSAFSH